MTSLGPYDVWEHIQGVTDYPAGKGGRTTTPGSGIAKLGSHVVLHAIIPLTGFVGALTITKGDGSAYFTGTWPAPGNTNGAGQPLDMELFDGLGIAGGTAGSWLILYEFLK